MDEMKVNLQVPFPIPELALVEEFVGNGIGEALGDVLVGKLSNS